MIIVRSPLRISLGGGGTDLASYYKEHEGFLIAAAIDKYIYVNVMRPFTKGIYLKYSNLEMVKKIKDIKHPIIRESLKYINPSIDQIEITTLADIPGGTGLGSSSSFSTALLKALYAHERKQIHHKDLAELACHIEIDLLKEPIGKQDQYISTTGGITSFKFNKDDSVDIKPLNLTEEVVNDLEDNLLLFFTGYSREAGSILQDQKDKSLQNDQAMIANLDYVKKIGYESMKALEKGNTDKFGELMHEHWENKKKRSGGMSNQHINDWYDLAMRNGAIGGKLVGAGGGGFLMFMAHDAKKLRTALANAGMEEVRFRFDFEGTKSIKV